MPREGFQRLNGPLETDKSFMRSESFEMRRTSDMQEDEGKEEGNKPKHGPTDLRYASIRQPGSVENVDINLANTRRRALSERHVNMIAFSSTIGIGCFLQSGKVIHLIGPGGAVL